MLEMMRKKANSWLMIVLFGVIIFVFAVNFGPWSGGKLASNTNYAAEVNGHPISLQEFNRIYQAQLRQMQSYQPGLTPEIAEAQGFKGMILDRLVTIELLAQVAQENGLSIPDKELTDVIRTRIFGDAKNFNAEEYKRIVTEMLQTTEAQFEAQMRHELLAQRAVELIGTGAQVTDDEVRQNFLDKNNRVSLEFVRIDPTFFASSTKSSDADLKAYVATHEKDISDYYNAHISEFRTEKRVKASHILAKFKSGATDAEKKSAKDKITAAQGRLKKGEDFAKVAKEVSEDGSAANGGNLGFFGKGMMVKPFEDAAFALQQGQTSDVVESPFGYHLIKVEDVELPVHKSVEEAQPEIAQRLINQDASKKQAQDFAQATLTKLKSGTSLKALQLPQSKDTFSTPKADASPLFPQKTRYVPGIGESAELVEAAFALSKEKPVADKVFEVNGKSFVVRLKDKEVADLASFEKEKDSLKANLLVMKKNQYIQSYIDQLKKNATLKYNASLSPKIGEENPEG